MKFRSPLLAAVLALALAIAPRLNADVIYYGLQNVAIPLNFNGVYVNLQTGVVATPTFTATPNWDINPFFGGDGVANSPYFQPARTGTNNQDIIVNLAFGATISGSLNYSTGYGGSQGHTGNGANQFPANTEGYIGFQYTPSGTTYNGWMRAILNPNTSGGMLMDWAYETTTGGTIAAGNIQQAAPVSGVSIVTLTAASGETPRLGSTLADVGGGNVTSVVKVGSGTWTLVAANTYSGTTSVTAGRLLVSNSSGSGTGTSTVTVNGSGTTLGGTGTISGTVTLGNNTPGAILNPGASGSNGTAASVGTLTTGALTLTGANTIHIDAFGIAANQWDRLTSTGAIDLGSTSTLDITIASGLGFGQNTIYTLLSGSSLTGTFNGIVDGQIYSFSGYDFMADYTGTEFDLIAVPEPGTWIAGFLSLAALFYAQRRRIIGSRFRSRR